jgi:hypothetical protein
MLPAPRCAPNPADRAAEHLLERNRGHPQAPADRHVRQDKQIVQLLALLGRGVQQPQRFVNEIVVPQLG